MNTYVLKSSEGTVFLRMTADSTYSTDVTVDEETGRAGDIGYAKDLIAKGANVQEIASRMGSHKRLEVEGEEHAPTEPSERLTNAIAEARAALAKMAIEPPEDAGPEQSPRNLQQRLTDARASRAKRPRE